MRVIGLGIAVFAAALGVMVGHKLSSEAMAVIVGVVLGVVATLPVSVLLVVVLRKATQRPEPQQQSQQAYPPVVVVGTVPQLSGPQRPDPWTVDGAWRPATDKPRFRVLGEE